MQRKSSGDSTEFAKEFEDKLAMSGPASMDVDESIDEEKPEDHQLDEEYAEPDSIDVEEEEHVTYSSPQASTVLYCIAERLCIHCSLLGGLK